MAKNDSMSIMNQYKNAPEKEKVESKRVLKVGIIGTGWIADAHASKYKEMADVEVVALADLVPGKAERFAKKWDLPNARCYLSHKELLDSEQGLDAVSICTYNRTHAECTIYALRKAYGGYS